MSYPLTSVLMNTIEQLRGLVDDPEVQGRYTNQYLVKHIVRPSIDKVVSSLANSASCPVVCFYPITATGEISRITLPPNVRSVLMIAERVNNINTSELVPRHIFHNQGRGWSIEGQDLVFDPPITIGNSSASLNVVYEPSGSHSPIYDPASGPANTEAFLDSTDSKKFYLAKQPQLGVTDTRTNAYAGATLRIFKKDDGSIDITEEIWIDSSGYDSSNSRWYLTLKTAPVNYAAGTTKLHYEVGPPYSPDLVEAITM
ncbi:MAG: hypothetical protein D6812_15110, partial [Deltaproteobacteria bacterium]